MKELMKKEKICKYLSLYVYEGATKLQKQW